MAHVIVNDEPSKSWGSSQLIPPVDHMSGNLKQPAIFFPSNMDLRNGISRNLHLELESSMPICQHPPQHHLFLPTSKQQHAGVVTEDDPYNWSGLVGLDILGPYLKISLALAKLTYKIYHIFFEHVKDVAHSVAL